MIKFQSIDHDVSNNKLVYWFPIYLQAANKMLFHIHWNLDNIWINHVKLKITADNIFLFIFMNSLDKMIKKKKNT